LTLGSSTASYFTYGFTTKSNPTKDTDYDVIDDDNILFDFAFPGGSNPCATLSIDIPSGGINGEEIVGVRIAQCSAAGTDFGIMPPEEAARLLGMTVYIEKGINSSISTTADNSFNAYFSENVLTLTEPASVSVYTISGILIKCESNTQSVLLNYLDRGVYIIKARNNTGKNIVTKIAKH
jgi:hypothetical protein